MKLFFKSWAFWTFCNFEFLVKTDSLLPGASCWLCVLTTFCFWLVHYYCFCYCFCFWQPCMQPSMRADLRTSQDGPGWRTRLSPAHIGKLSERTKMYTAGSIVHRYSFCCCCCWFSRFHFTRKHPNAERPRAVINYHSSNWHDNRP